MERPNPEPDEGSTQNQASEDKKFRKRAMVLAEREHIGQATPSKAPPSPHQGLSPPPDPGAPA